MKKTLAIILSVVMIFSMVPFTGLAADDSVYDRSAVASNDEAYIADMTAEQIASVILDWVDREIAKVTADFGAFNVKISEDIEVPVEIDVKSLDDIVAYKDYLAELGGDFASLDATNLITRAQAGSAIEFINGVLQFMADNSDTFGKVFRWDSEVFDYGKVGEYILSLDTTDEDNKKIVDFYNDYLIGNDIQDKFVTWIADQMNYTIPEGEAFDDTLNNGIIGWFAGLCYDANAENNLLSEEAYEELLGYNLKTTDIYTLVKNFVALVQSDNQVKIDTYYNYIMDTVVRSLLKTTLGQKATVGGEADVPATFATTYTDLALLEEISGGIAYYQDADGAYYEVTIADGAATAKTVVWESVVDFEFPTATIYTGADCDQEVQVYYPTSKDSVKVYTYATEKNQALLGEDSGLEFTGTAVPAEYTALMTEDNAKTLADSFGVTVAQGEEIISELVVTFKEIEEYAEAQALPVAQTTLEELLANANLPIAVDVTIEAIDVVLSYNGYATEDEFICEVVVDSVSVTLAGTMASMVQSYADSAAATAVGTYIDTPVATIVVDGISGDQGIDASGAKDLYEFIDTDFVIDADLLDIAGNYDDYDGAVGQVNHILYGLVDMLVSDNGMTKLDLKDGDNTNLNANLEKICATANDMMASAEAIMQDEEVKALLGEVGLDTDALLAGMDMDLLYAIDFTSVEALWVSVINLGLDIIDNGTNTTITEIHTAIGDLENLDAMAVAATDYILGKCIPAVNDAFNDSEFNAYAELALTVPAKTDAATVADGEGKDIIMTKLVDVAFDASTWAMDDLLNAVVNEFIGSANAEAGTDLPTVAFAFGVDKGADWEATLTAIVNRVYELADGIIIACDNDYTDTIDKISAVANAILPLGSLASNCASDDGKLAFDINKVLGYLFDDGLNGNLDGFLGLFETDVKTADVASDCSVTEALINASQHIVDSIFPGTVVASDYVNLADYTDAGFTAETVQEYFTSAANDQVIASRNMDSINERKADLVPAALRLVVEAGILPYFAKCGLDHSAEDLAVVEIKGKEATCTEDGVETAYACADCGYIVRGGGTIEAKKHNYVLVEKVDPTCTAEGSETYECSNDNCDATYTDPIDKLDHNYEIVTVVTEPGCESTGVERHACDCGAYKDKDIPATGHADEDSDNICDGCGSDLSPAEEEDNSFFARIRVFIQRIIDWFKNLFNF